VDAPSFLWSELGRNLALSLLSVTWLIVLRHLARWSAPWFKRRYIFTALFTGAALLALATFLEFPVLYGLGGEFLAAARTVLCITGAILLMAGIFPLARRITTLLRRLDRAANTDILTGARTRHAVFAVMQDLIRRQRPFSIIIGDLDGLKPINDRYGHAAGDQLLVETTAVIQSSLPEGTEIARIGGDEFLAVLPGAPCSLDLLETIRRRVRELPFPYPVGISLGYACYPGDGDRLQTVMAVADARMYDDKRRCRKESLIISVS